MKSFAASILLSVSLALMLSPSALAQTSQEKSLNNQSVVKLVKAGFKEKTIIEIINARLPNFDLSPDRMIELKRNGVPEKVIMAMLSRQEGMEPFDDSESWSDGDFMSKGMDPKSGNANSGSGNTSGGGGSSDQGTNIFGSSGGVKGRTQSNTGNGGVDNDVVTTGSATVRIIKPPSESGGNGAGSVKLEKTKSLTNDSIVELVEAGFSEGTIIRRIEQSPVEFDLSATKMEELRKRRVSDKILAAMKTAMGDGK